MEDKNNEAAPSIDAEAQSNSSAFSRLLKRTRRYLHFMYPNHIHDPEMKLSDLRKRDVKDNLKTKSPKVEKVRLNTLWAMELYTQNQLHDLNESLKQLNWHKSSRWPDNRDLGKWLEYQRVYGAGDSFLNLGCVVRTKKGMPPHIEYTAPIPAGVSYLVVTIHQITESLTGVAVGFVLEEELSSNYEKELNTDRKTCFSRSKGQRGYSILDVQSLKEQACLKTRNHVISLAKEWFQSNLPGFFCNSSNQTNLPTVELITNKSEKLISSTDEPSNSEFWIRALGLGTKMDVWESSEIGKVRLTTETNHHTRMQADFHAICNIQETDIPEKSVAFYGSGSVEKAITYICSNGLGSFLCWFSVIAFLFETRKNIRNLRASLTKTEKSYKKMMKTLKTLEDFFGSYIGPSIAINQMSNLSPKYFSFHSLHFTSVNLHGAPNANVVLSETLKKRIQQLRDEIITEVEITREMSMAYASLSNSRENNKTQRTMKWLVAMTLVITLISIAHSMSSAPINLFNIYIS